MPGEPDPVRVLATVPRPGELVLSKDLEGWRHFLDGRPVHDGDELELWVQHPESFGEVLVEWVPCRVVLTSLSPPHVALEFEAGFFPKTRRPASALDTLRWPTGREAKLV